MFATSYNSAEGYWHTRSDKTTQNGVLQFRGSPLKYQLEGTVPPSHVIRSLVPLVHCPLSIVHFPLGGLVNRQQIVYDVYVIATKFPFSF